MKKILTLILGSAISSSISYADTASANYIKHYLQIVYPTSNELQAMSESQIQEVYTNELNTWFRVPMPSFESGLFANITPQYRVFVFPDTAARTRTDLANKQMLAKNGFNSQEVILGSNKNYIEVSSLAWMNFPFGAYFNWAHGSGIYLNTEGKTISGYTKVDILYKIYLKNNQLDQYYTRLATSQMVQGEIFASNLPLEQLLNIYAKSTKVSDYAKSVDYIKFTEQNFHIANGAMPLAVAILGTSEWDKEKQTQFANLVADKQYNKAYRMLLEIYVNDHKNG
ncbi:MAG: hypothetical protein RLZZ293_729, partial [Pseudomonadota bacterium]